MSSIVHTLKIDDLDGTSPADATVVWEFNNGAFEIDLTAENEEEFRQILGKYIAVARPKTAQAKSTKIRHVKHDPKAIRSWAKEKGYKISDRGRIHSELILKYQEEMSPAAAS